MEMPSVRLVADKSTGTRLPRFDPLTGERKLVNPATPGEDHEPWPCLGIEFTEGTPKEFTPSANFVVRGRNEGWANLVNEKVVHRPGGPPEDEWRVTHTFYHCDAIEFKLAEGGVVRYRVTGLPDKYVAGDKSGGKKVTPKHYEDGETEIRWFYDLRLEANDG